MSDELRKILSDLGLKLTLVIILAIPFGMGYYLGFDMGQEKGYKKYSDTVSLCLRSLNADDSLPGFTNLLINNTCVETSEMSKAYVDALLWNCVDEKMKSNE